MERVAFGYCDSEARNLLGEKVFEYRDSIKELAERYYNVKISAYFGGNVFPLSGDLLRIRLEGKLDGLESATNELFKKFGLPDLVDTPFSLSDKFLNSIPPRIQSEELTTKPAYAFIKKIFKMENVKSEELEGNVCIRR